MTVINYRGFILDVEKEKDVTGQAKLSFSAKREEDGLYLVDEVEDLESTSVEGKVRELKKEIDKFYKA